MKKVIQSKWAAVLIFNHVCWFWSYFGQWTTLNKMVAMATTLFTVYCKLFHMMPYIIILKVRKFHQPTASRFSTARKKPVGGGAHCAPLPAWIGLKGYFALGNFQSVGASSVWRLKNTGQEMHNALAINFDLDASDAPDSQTPLWSSLKWEVASSEKWPLVSNEKYC